MSSHAKHAKPKPPPSTGRGARMGAGSLLTVLAASGLLVLHGAGPALADNAQLTYATIPGSVQDVATPEAAPTVPSAPPATSQDAPVTIPGSTSNLATTTTSPESSTPAEAAAMPIVSAIPELADQPVGAPMNTTPLPKASSSSDTIRFSASTMDALKPALKKIAKEDDFYAARASALGIPKELLEALEYRENNNRVGDDVDPLNGEKIPGYPYYNRDGHGPFNNLDEVWAAVGKILKHNSYGVTIPKAGVMSIDDVAKVATYWRYGEKLRYKPGSNIPESTTYLDNSYAWSGYDSSHKLGRMPIIHWDGSRKGTFYTDDQKDDRLGVVTLYVALTQGLEEHTATDASPDSSTKPSNQGGPDTPAVLTPQPEPLRKDDAIPQVAAIADDPADPNTPDPSNLDEVPVVTDIPEFEDTAPPAAATPTTSPSKPTPQPEVQATTSGSHVRKGSTERTLADTVKPKYGYTINMPASDPASKNMYYFSQNKDSRWAHKDGVFGSGHDVAECGCGPTSLAMIISTLKGELVTPVQVAKVMRHHGALNWPCGTNGEGKFAEVLAEFGLHGKRAYSDWSQVDDTLKAGGLVAVSTNHSAFGGSHYIVIRGITADGRYLVANPLMGKAEDGRDYSKSSFKAWHRSAFHLNHGFVTVTPGA